MTGDRASARDAAPDATGIFAKGDLLASFAEAGIKPSRAAKRLDELLPQLTRAELKEIFDWMTLQELADPETTPERRRELLAGFDRCPCCERWLGHNKPPADQQRQEAFDF
jgi:hypothetical protein